MVLGWMLLTQTLYLISLPYWLVAAGLSFMAFDAPGSTRKVWPYVIVLLAWSYPLLP
jgi:hypothetical protein